MDVGSWLRNLGLERYEAALRENEIGASVLFSLTAEDLKDLKAETYFDRALAIARGQQARSWELRAAMSMARLWLAQGKQNETRQPLAPIYGWFTEGFVTLDLKRAKELLDAH